MLEVSNFLDFLCLTQLVSHTESFIDNFNILTILFGADASYQLFKKTRMDDILCLNAQNIVQQKVQNVLTNKQNSKNYTYWYNYF